MASNNWYVLTGGPATGKTTLLAKLEKSGYAVVPEAARTVIDNARKNGIPVEHLRAVESDFQHAVTKLKQDIELSLSKDTPTFFDRGMHDTLAYLRCIGMKLEDWELELMHSSTYRQVFLLEPLAVYEKDYARTEDGEFIQKIHEELHKAYDEFGMTPVRVPAMSVKQRITFIIDNIQQTQGGQTT